MQNKLPKKSFRDNKLSRRWFLLLGASSAIGAITPFNRSFSQALDSGFKTVTEIEYIGENEQFSSFAYPFCKGELRASSFLSSLGQNWWRSYLSKRKQFVKEGRLLLTKKSICQDHKVVKIHNTWKSKDDFKDFCRCSDVNALALEYRRNNFRFKIISA